jgi:hypothetical protein
MSSAAAELSLLQFVPNGKILKKKYARDGEYHENSGFAVMARYGTISRRSAK